MWTISILKQEISISDRFKKPVVVPKLKHLRAIGEEAFFPSGLTFPD